MEWCDPFGGNDSSTLMQVVMQTNRIDQVSNRLLSNGRARIERRRFAAIYGAIFFPLGRSQTLTPQLDLVCSGCCVALRCGV